MCSAREAEFTFEVIEWKAERITLYSTVALWWI